MSFVTFVGACGGLGLGAAAAQALPFISNLQANPAPIATTVPMNGDQNPYGIVTVPNSIGALKRGNLLISNFNNSTAPAGEQGTGTTIVQIAPAGNNVQGTASLFAQISDPACPGGVGLTTALAVTRTGYVIVGSLPTSDGTSATAQAGCLIVLNSNGHVVETIAGGPINGPWDMTASENGIFTTLYVTNVLNGTVAADTGGPTVPGNVVNHGTVVRIELLTIPGVRPIVLDEHVIATGFAERTDPNALVVGPTGDALARDGTLYVADTQNSRIAAIPDAPFRDFPVRHGGFTVSSGGDLNGPLGMTLAPNGDILTANGGDGNIVETTPFGSQTDISADATGGGGALFGLTVPPGADGIYFVDDADNTLRELVPAP
ncbi:MAG TPA: hypothetical protein VME22_01830 [Solirubrobacteraceae bacterium]|nr:hypothetical protein [Solirubrobacteraceae bacterium]